MLELLHKRKVRPAASRISRTQTAISPSGTSSPRRRSRLLRNPGRFTDSKAVLRWRLRFCGRKSDGRCRTAQCPLLLDSPLNRVWTASPTESVLVKRTDVQRAAKVGYRQVAPAGATRFWQRTLAFYFSEFSDIFLGGERAEANSRQATCNLAPIWHRNPALEWVFSGMASC